MPRIITKPKTDDSPRTTSTEVDHLRPYADLGLDLSKPFGSTQAMGECPFCGKEKKFAVSLADGRWRCYVCAEGSDRTAAGGGNVYTFLQKFHSIAPFPADKAAQLAKDRKLTGTKSLETWGFRVNPITGDWFVPSYNADGKINNLYQYRSPKLGGKKTLVPLAGLKIGMFGRHTIDPEKPYIDVLEGPWDAMAYFEILRLSKQVDGGKLEITGSESASLYGLTNVIAVPGAANWQDAWAPVVSGKRVSLLFDSDHPKTHAETGKVTQPGLDGMKRTSRMILVNSENRPTSVQAISWGLDGYDPEKPTGYDVRDHLSQKETYRDRIPLLQTLLDKVQPIPPEWVPGRTDEANHTGSSEVQLVDCDNWNALVGQWKKALQWSPAGTGLDHGLAAMLASIASVRMPDDQLWIQVISPPSTGKTTMAEGCGTCVKYTKEVSSIRGLHSGYMSDADGDEDNSLMAQIKDKTLIIKDGDTLLKAPNRDQIMSEMRDAYDTNSATNYRNKIKRDYRGHRFSIIICGTEAMLELDTADLGARYLTVVIMEGIDEKLEMSVNWKRFMQIWSGRAVEANGDISTHSDPAKVLARQMTGGYVRFLRENTGELLGNLVMTGPEQQHFAAEFDRCARFVAHMRSRPSKKQDEVPGGREMSSRLMTQLTKLGMCLAVVLNKTKLDDDVMSRVRRVTLDSSRGNSIDIARIIYEKGKEGISAATLADMLHDSTGRTKSLLGHLKRIKVVETFRPPSNARPGQKAIQKPYKWKLTDSFHKLYESVVNPKKEK